MERMTGIDIFTILPMLGDYMKHSFTLQTSEQKCRLTVVIYTPPPSGGATCETADCQRVVCKA